MADEVEPEVIRQTQKVLGKYVKKPQLAEKLLRKPPFRFLHDVVRAVVQETGFLKGLFSVDELVSDNVKEREKKVAFLNKLIDATKAISGVELSVKSSKIVAGLEPTQTNLLLQTIGKAIDKKLDSTQYVQQLKQKSKTKPTDNESKIKKTSESVTKNRQKLKEEMAAAAAKEKRSEKSRKESSKKNLISPTAGNDNKKKPEKSKKPTVGSKTVISPKREEEKPPVDNTEKNEKPTIQTITKTEATAANDLPAPSSASDLEIVESVTVPEIENVATVSAIETEKKNDEVETIIETKVALKRPKSARPKSGDRNKQNEEEVIPQPLTSNTLRPPSVRPSSARPGAPRLHPDFAMPLQEPVTMGKINVIVENFDQMDDTEEETVVIENAPEEVDVINPQIDLNMPQEKGQLVEEILKQITDEDGDKVKVSNDWQVDTFKSKSAAKDIEQLRNSIQMLTRVANPFGKLISYLHEDIETMYNELNMWKSMKRQTYAEIKKHEKMREELCKPLHDQLSNLEDAIKKQEEDILNMRAKILRNDIRSKQLLSQLV